MSKQINKKTATSQAKPASPVKAEQPAMETPAVAKPFHIGFPLLWLCMAVLAVYWSSLQFGFTELDDSIFIKELHSYNEDLSNLVTSFRRGVFDAVKDTYYRPMFLNSMLLNYQLSGQNVSGYHVVNLLLHVASVILVYKLFRRIELSNTTSFLLALLFAVHPVLSQAVAWIPGRNDTLMAVFVLPFLICSIDYSSKQKPLSLVLASLFLLAALFTKETALLAPAVSFIVLVLIMKHSWKEKPLLVQYGIWIAALAVYFAVRSTATLKQQLLVPSEMLHDFVNRLPLLVQYLGKIFLPFNLSVFPIQQDTVYYFGIAAVVLLTVLILLAKQRNNRIILAGALIFLVFLLPVLFVPNTLNEQTFEHRLYLPILGILLIFSQTAVFKNDWKDSTRTYVVAAIAVVFAGINYNHQQYFNDPISFWSKATETSPHSAYATMMYAARMENREESYVLMRKAYALNPDEKYLNYYYGVMLQNQDSVLESEKYFLKEQKISDYYECDFYLAQIDYKKQDKDGAQRHLERYLTRDSMNMNANNNLLLLYLETGKKDNALRHINAMKRRGQNVAPGLIQQAQAMR